MVRSAAELLQPLAPPACLTIVASDQAWSPSLPEVRAGQHRHRCL